MTRIRAAVPLMIVVPALALTACSTSSGTASVATAQPPAGAATSAAAAPTSAAASTKAAPQAGPATSLDPCQLVTSAEASALAGVSFGPGKSESSGTSGKLCVYGAQTHNVFTVVVGQAKDAATAGAEWVAEQAQAEAALKEQVPSGATVSLHKAGVSGLADKAETVTGSAAISGVQFGASAIFLLKGATFVQFSDVVVGTAPPSTAALESQARTTLGRVP